MAYTVEERGALHTLDYRAFISTNDELFIMFLVFIISVILKFDSLLTIVEGPDGSFISPFHDIPTWANDEVASDLAISYVKENHC